MDEPSGAALTLLMRPTTCPFRKFHPVQIRAVRQNHRIIRVDAFEGPNCLTVRQFLARQRGDRPGRAASALLPACSGSPAID